MNSQGALLKQFARNAEAVSAVVGQVTDQSQVFDYIVDLCVRKEACQLLASGCEAPLSDAADGLCREKQQKVMAAPDLPADAWRALRTRCEPMGILLSDRPLREHLAGIDIGLTTADYGIAETGTLVIDAGREDVRLTTMISEIHVAVLPVSRLRAGAEDLEQALHAMQGTPGRYLAFITGASRTADIERVLAIGVHGPLELHILMMEDG